MIDSIYGRDYPVIQGLTLALAMLVSLIFLVTDIVQAALDPRVGAMTAQADPAAASAGARLRLPRLARRRPSCWREPLVTAAAPGWSRPMIPLAFDYVGDPAGAELRASLRHRQFRPRRPLARHLRLPASTCRSRSSRPSHPFVFGTIVGALVGYYGGWLDTLFGRVVDARHHLPVPRAGHRHRLRARAGPGQHVHRRRRRRLGVLRPAGARPR